MRISQEMVDQRESFLTTLFQLHPEMSVAKANELLKAKYGSNMRLNRAYEIRQEVREKVGYKEPTNGGAAASAATEVPSPVKEAVVVPMSQKIREAIDALNSLGITKLTAEIIMGGKYMVVANQE